MVDSSVRDDRSRNGLGGESDEKSLALCPLSGIYSTREGS